MVFEKTLATICIAAAAFVGVAKAQTIDQQQPLIDVAAGYLGVGGDSEQKLAQTFQVGMTGSLIAVDLPLACSGPTLIEIRRQASGRPEGALLRAIRFTGTSLGPVGFQRYYLPSGLAVNAGDLLAFTVISEGSNCNYATAPVGDTYPRGEAFFDARPNPPGWISQKEFPASFQDLPFKTVMASGTSRRSGRCVAVGVTDPATGAWLELPISADLPACRCFEDEGLREFRCGAFHRDFFAIRRIPWPLKPGQPYTEVWDFTPLANLDGPVTMRLEGAGHAKPVIHYFGFKAQPGTFERKSFQNVAPLDPKAAIGGAFFDYPMKDATSEYEKRFGVDLTVEP